MNKKILTGIWFVLLLYGCKHNTEVPEPLPENITCLPDVEDRYEFPITPGSDEWDSLEPEELIQASQLPDDVLKKISTAGLIRSFWDVAVIAERYTDFYEFGYNEGDFYFWLCPSINSVQELFKRKDAGEALIGILESISLDCMEKMTVNEREFFSDRYNALLTLFIKKEVTDQLNEAYRNKLVDLLMFNVNRTRELKLDGFRNDHSGEVMAYMMHTLLKDQLDEQFPTCDELIISDRECLPDIADMHIYPEMPWSEVYTYQIPDDVLENMSTFGLIRSCLDYPLLRTEWYASSEIGAIYNINRTFSRRNVARELYSRNDASEALLRYYHAIGFDCVEQRNKLMIALDFPVQITAVAVFMTQEEISQQLDKKKAVALILSKYGQMQVFGNLILHGGSHEAMYDIMLKAQYQPIMDHSENPYYYNQNEVISLAINFIR